MKHEIRLLRQICTTSHEKMTAITEVAFSKGTQEPFTIMPLFLENTLAASTSGGDIAPENLRLTYSCDCSSCCSGPNHSEGLCRNCTQMKRRGKGCLYCRY